MGIAFLTILKLSDMIRYLLLFFFSLSMLLLNNCTYKDIEASIEDITCPDGFGTPFKSGGKEVFTKSYRLGKQGVNFSILYRMFDVPDELNVYCGQGTDGDLIYTTGGFVSGEWIITLPFDCYDTEFITLELIGNPNAETIWYYELRCVDP